MRETEQRVLATDCQGMGLGALDGIVAASAARSRSHTAFAARSRCPAGCRERR